MSEISVNKDADEGDQKKVTFSEEKEADKTHDEEIDEEGRKSRGSGTGSSRCRTSSSEMETSQTVRTTNGMSNAQGLSDCEQSVKEESRKESVQATPPTQGQDVGHTNDTTTVPESNGEVNGQHLTDDDKRQGKSNPGTEPEAESETTQNTETPSRYSLSSRPVTREAMRDVNESHNKEEPKDGTQHEREHMTDEEKLAQTNRDTKQLVKQEKKVDSKSGHENNTVEENFEPVSKSQQAKEEEKPKLETERPKEVNSGTKTQDDMSAEKNIRNKTTERKPSPPQVMVVEKPKPKQPPNDQKQTSAQNKPRSDRPAQSQQPARKNPPKPPERSNSPRQIIEKTASDRKAQSARYPINRYGDSSRDSTPRASSRTSSRWSRPISRPRTCGYLSERRRKEKEFFYAELNRLKDSLKKESKKIKKPKVRDHYPDVFTSLEPYYNTYTADYLINMPDMGYKVVQPPSTPRESKHEEEKRDLMYTTRCTAIGLTDPWDSLNMDRSVLPKIESSEMRKKRMEQLHVEPKRKSTTVRQNRPATCPTPKTKRPEAKQGSTRLPKFPVIQPPNSELTTKELHYGDVPMLRNELAKSFSHNGDSKKKSDYTRTRQDFYRMELDRLEDYHVLSRPHMRAAYFAYLQNTPGSRKALYDCIKELSGSKNKEPMSPQAVA